MKPRRTDKRFVLATSALIAYNAGESGEEKVAEILRSGDKVLMSEISLMELYHIYLREAGEREARQVVGLCQKAGIEWAPITRAILLRGAKLKANYRLAAADAIVAGTAQEVVGTLVHKDQKLSVLSPEVAMMDLASEAGDLNPKPAR